MKPSMTAQQRMQCLKGTFAVENMAVSTSTYETLKRLETNQANIHELVRAAVARHTRKQ